MPIYDFECVLCGEFSASSIIAKREKPLECAECGLEAKRLISAPNLALMNPVGRKAATINERSAHAPRVSNAHSCGSRCGCGTKIRSGRTKQPRLGVAQTSKVGARPWMLGH